MFAVSDDSQQLIARPGQGTRLRDALSRAQELLRHSLAQNTRRAYAERLEAFLLLVPGASPAGSSRPARNCGIYLTTLAESYKVSTLTRRISAISQAHQAAGFDSPTQAPVVRQLMKGIRRTLGTAQAGKSPGEG